MSLDISNGFVIILLYMCTAVLETYEYHVLWQRCHGGKHAVAHKPGFLIHFHILLLKM